MPQYQSLGRALIVVLLALLLSGCAHVDRKRFGSLRELLLQLRKTRM